MPAKKAPKGKSADAEAEAAEAARVAAEAEAARLRELAQRAAHAREQPDVSELPLTDGERARARAAFADVAGPGEASCLPVAKLSAALSGCGTRLSPEDEASLVLAHPVIASCGVDGWITLAEFLSVLAGAYASPKFHGEALRLAVGRGERATAERLLRMGCDPCASDGAGRTVAHIAADLNQLSVLRAVRDTWGEEEFDHDVPDKTGWTPLAVAARNGFADVVEALLSWGADPDAASNQGRTPMHAACAADAPAVVRLLAAAGANPNAADKAGWTPMHIAALHGASRCVDALAAAGASATQADRFGRAPDRICHPEASLALRKATRSSRGSSSSAAAAAAGSGPGPAVA